MATGSYVAPTRSQGEDRPSSLSDRAFYWDAHIAAAVAGRAVAKPNNLGRCCLAALNSVARNRLALGGAEVFRSRAGIR